MSEESVHIGEDKLRRYLRKVTADLREARRHIDEMEQREREPIAVIGMACRYPGGVSSPAQLWELVDSGTDAIGEFPTDRGWDLERLYDPDPDHTGTTYSRHGGFLYDSGEFDADFFAIGPREALAMDPQQRILLECAWETFEDAGIDPASLVGSQTGVFAGVMHNDYGVGAGAALAELEGYRATGIEDSVISGRLAYTFGLEGPAVSLDTACSSSLVTIHLASQALRLGECELALAGGVTVFATPTAFIEFSRQRGLAADGRCKSFSAGANGIGWAEGVGLVMLERLSQARRNGHRVLALVRGSAVNQDGASNGLTAPNGPSQERVIRQALTSAGLSPSEIDAVEAHGTGTPLGDPIEAQALLATYGQGRPDGRPLWLGALKSNIGHSAAAAGVAGIIKTVQAMRHGKLPKTLHADERSPHVDWSEGAVQLLNSPVDWSAGERVRRAGVSSFGVSGTNAHVILEEAPVDEVASTDRHSEETHTVAVRSGGVADPPEPGVLPFLLSASTREALRGQAVALAECLKADPAISFEAVASRLGLGRARLSHRAVIVAEQTEELIVSLEGLARGEAANGLIEGVADGGRKVAFMFSGQGSQWAGMGRELWESSPTFAAQMRACADALAVHCDWSLEDVLRGESDASSLERVDVVQPALFAVMVSLATLWRSYGVEPAVVVGHSQGEIAAAHVAGGLSLEDAARVVVLRSRALAEELSGRGGMLSVALSSERVQADLRQWDTRLSLAVVNGPSSVVVSGEPAALRELLAQYEGQGVRARMIPVDYASHSTQIEAIEQRLAQELASIAPRSGEIPFHSTTTGTLLDTAELDGAYWYTNLRQTVHFHEATQALLASATTAFIEMSPHPVLTMAVEDTVEGQGLEQGSVVAVGSLRREQGNYERFLVSLAEAYVHGVDIDWNQLFDGESAKGVELPSYPFQRKRYWLTSQTGVTDASSLGQASAEHPLLGATTALAGERQSWLFTGRLSLQSHPWLADHAAMESVLMPGTGFLELALAAGQRVDSPLVEELTLEQPLLFGDDDALHVQISVSEPDEEGKRAIGIYSRPQRAQESAGVAEEWTRHASGTLATGGEDPLLREELRHFTAQSWPPEGAQAIDTDSLYERLAEAGYNYGPVFQGLRCAWRVGDELYAEIALEQEQIAEAAEFAIHPALSDAALHTALLSVLDDAHTGEVGVPFSFSGVHLYGQGASALRVRLGGDGGTLSLSALDGDGAPVFAIRALETRVIDRNQLQAARSVNNDSLYAFQWVQLQSATADGVELRAALLGDGEGIEAPWIDLERFADLNALTDALNGNVPVPELVLIYAGAIAGPVEREHEAGARASLTIDGELAERVRTATLRMLELAQQWIACEALAEARLVLLTESAVAATAGEAPNLTQAALVGLMRSAQSEHPGRFGVVDLDGSQRSSDAPLHGALMSEEPELALRDGMLHAPRLVRAAVQPEASVAEHVNPDGTVLITGGTGGLGALLAMHLVTECGVKRLLLASRSGEKASGAKDLGARLRELGCEVRIAACDVSDSAQVAELIQEISPEHPLSTVIQASGVLDDGLLETMDEERLWRVMKPKVDAAVNLHELTQRAGPAEFILFSSAAATVGSPGQSNYAAANAFLDALAAHRRATGLPALSLAWGAWDQSTGMTGTLSESDRARIARVGISSLSDEQGLELFDLARGMDETLLVPMSMDMAALRSQAKAGMLPAVLRGLVRMPARRASDAKGSLARKLAQASETEWEAIVLELVRDHVAGVLGHTSAEAVDPQRAFKELGFDSLGAVELRNRLNQASDLKLPSTLIFDHPTPVAVAEYLRSKVEGTESAARTIKRSSGTADEPIAIVGMSCRYPGGVSSPADLWQLVASGTDAIGEFPNDRGWDLERLFDPDPDNPGTSYSRHGGFLYDAGEFDAEFFSIGPREALAMDPQQRLLLESAWEAFEDANVDPLSLRGSQTGVFTGVMYQDYGTNAGPMSAEVEGYIGTGSAGSVVSGRLAYTFGLEGPAVSVDTACSSSLVAIHLACQALRSGECELALAGGVTVLASPGLFIGFSRQRGLSVDGRCKSFGAGADGAGFSEGAGLLALERISEAERKGHRILGLVRGSAVNQDGASNGLTAPNGPSQERVIRQALAGGGLSAAEVDVVEAHGTGTTLGDPIEAQALLATYGQDRADGRPLWLGSVKSNIGHTQAAAGVAGVIKMVMAMRHHMLPRTLHVDEPSPYVDWSEGDVQLLREQLSWQPNGRARRAGVSSFGVSGTNAHVILEEAPFVEVQNGDGPVVDTPKLGVQIVPFVLSAASSGALAGQAGALRSLLTDEPETGLRAVGGALALRRPSLAHRAVVLAEGHEDLVSSLGALERGEIEDRVVRGMSSAVSKVAFLFPGQGSQWVGMGSRLWDTSPVFAEQMQACADAFSTHFEWSLKDVLCGEDGAPSLERVDIVQPALFSVMISLAALWRSFGVEPAVVLGHSQGEIAAAYTAGGLSLEDAATVVALRSRALADRLSGRGGMASVSLPSSQVEQDLQQWGQRISLAVINGPTSVVVSGEPEALDEMVARYVADGVRARRIPVDYASHSVQVEAIQEQLSNDLASISPRSGEIPFYSVAAGRLCDTAELDGAYWYTNLRETVNFYDATRALLENSVTTFIEASPHPVLTMAVEETIEAQGPGAAGTATAIGSLKREQGGFERFLTSLAQAYVDGVKIDWGAVFDEEEAARVALPKYAFQRRRYWLTSAAANIDASSLGQSSAEHPLLGAAVRLAGEGDGWLFTGRLALDTHSWLADHAVMGSVLMPGMGFVELALAAGQHVEAEVVEELTLQAPLLLSDGAMQLQISVSEADPDGRRKLEIYSRPQAESAGTSGGGEDGWILHASGVLLATDHAEDRLTSLDTDGLMASMWPPAGAQELGSEFFYERLADAGYEYGPSFQGLRRAFGMGEDLFAEVALEEQQEGEARAFCVHPALSDAALQAVFLSIEEITEIRVPFSFSGVRLYGRGAGALRVRLTRDAEDALSLFAVDERGDPVFSIDSLQARAIDQDRLGPVKSASNDSLYEVEWVELAQSPDDVSQSRVAALGSGHDFGVTQASEGGLARYTDVRALETAIGEGAAVPETVFIEAGSLIAQEATDGDGMSQCAGEELAITVHRVTATVLALLQEWVASESLPEARLLVVSDGALAVERDQPPNLVQAAVAGLLRSAQSEHPGRFGVIDLDGSEASWSAVIGAAVEDEPELAIRRGVVLAPRFARAGSGGSLIPPPGEASWRIDTHSSGTLEGLALCAGPPADTLGAGQVRVAVHAAGLNFRDVLIALGMYPGEAPIGSEGAGVVLEVAPDVSGLAVGDRVMGLISNAFGPVATCESQLLVKMPDDWSFVQGASVPIVFLTAYYGLVDLAHLQEGEKLLVHGAAGGVGMAALQLAAHLGAEVFATAHPDKWDTLEELGIDESHIASSRSLDFKERFFGLTEQTGVDVVLDSLVGEFVDASLELLPRGGRFIEMGKADIRDPDEVAARHEGVRYRAFDLLEAGPERIQQMLVDVVELFQRGVLSHLPISTWDVRRGVEAFRFLRESRHIGKLVLSIPQPLERHGTVLITGGTGGLGALVARHLASVHHAKRLLLVSRSGPQADGAAELRDALGELGCEVQITACDVSDRAQLEQLIASLPGEHPLTMVVHAAGVLDDGLIESLDGERLARVFAPKVDAAIHLHELTQRMELREFVLFSSVAASIGSPGQGNYAAANAFLDALAAHRRANGLAGVSLAWGAWEQTTGMTGTLSDSDRARFDRLGIVHMSDEHGLELFDSARGVDEALMLPVPLEVSALRAQAKAGTLPAILRGLVRTTLRQASATDGSLARRLASSPESEWDGIVLELVSDQVAAVLGHTSANAIDPQRAFKDLGFDSLAAVELRNRLNQATGLKLGSTLVFDHPTPAATAEYVRSRLIGKEAARSTIDEQIDKLESALGSPVGDDDERTRIAARIQALTRRVEISMTEDSHVEDVLASATNDELFELIDRRRDGAGNQEGESRTQ
jgi:mycoketide-CoA synthase